MRAFSLFFEELKATVTNRKVFIPVIAVLFIPLLYSGMFLWAFWDPYDHLDELPVAVVNNDKGAVFNGEKLEIGDELVKNLKENKQFSWHFVSEEEAEKGLKNQKYYMVIKIPENFSKNATTLQDEHPKKMELIYMPNESFNFLSAQIGSTAIEKIKEEVSDTLTATYAETMFENIKEVAKGLNDASDGAGKLHDGIVTAKDGSTEIYKNLKVLAEKSISFRDGLQTAASGSERLNHGLDDLNNGFSQLNDGQTQLLEGAKKAEAGSKQLADGLQQSLAGMKEMNENLPQLTNGAAQLKDGASNLSASLEQWRQGAEQTKAGAVQVSAGLEQMATQLDAMISQTADLQEKEMLETLKNNVKQLAEGSKQVSEGIEQLSTSAAALKSGADQIASGAGRLYDGQLALSNGMKQLIAGQEQLAAGADTLTDGQTKLVQGLTTFGEKMNEAKSGIEQLASGSGQLLTGLNELSSGSAKLQDGVNKLASGSSELADGMGKLAEGSHELATKLKDGAKEVGNVKANKDVYDMFAKPVEVENKKINEVPNYGTGFAPYFLSLGLFVGALLLSIVFPLREPAGVPSSGISWFVGKFGVLMIAGALQALLADTVLLAGLGIDVQSVTMFILFSIITSLAFIVLIQFLVTTLGDPGRFVGIVILILQLTTSAGTFPLELIPKALQHFNAWLPMTYSVFGFKAVISSGDFAFMWKNAFILLGFTIILAAGTILYFTMQHKRQFYTMEQNAAETPKAL
ncbi:YhgE/Pip domain-containing protein [Bacillus alveayuensis]|uniref:YhgE/Pip domain-containing protein n=1 Tax=Aeribacillus alveayuensis TaxID=279215 RepID=UPI0005CCA677|nr:YhgE/Pip domain-containing protein [Bacillus alveayuensis]